MWKDFIEMWGSSLKFMKVKWKCFHKTTCLIVVHVNGLTLFLLQWGNIFWVRKRKVSGNCLKHREILKSDFHHWSKEDILKPYNFLVIVMTSYHSQIWKSMYWADQQSKKRAPLVQTFMPCICKVQCRSKSVLIPSPLFNNIFYKKNRNFNTMIDTKILNTKILSWLKFQMLRLQMLLTILRATFLQNREILSWSPRFIDRETP